MKQFNIIDDFLIFENKNNLFELEILNCKFWSIIRENVYNDIQKKKEIVGISHSLFRHKNIIQKIKYISFFFIHSFFTKRFADTEKDLIVINHSRRVFDKGFYNCIYTDLFLEKTNLSFIVLEIANFGFHNKKINTKNMIYFDRYDLKLYLKYFVNKFLGLNELSVESIDLIKDLIKKINDKFDVNIDEKKFIMNVKKSIFLHLMLFNMFRGILLKVKPKIIVEVVGYERRRKALNSAAKNLGITTIELQHGTMGKYHIAYNFKEKIKLSTFPDYIFTFGQFWKDNTRLPIKDDNVRVVGWPYFENKVNYYKSKEKKSSDKLVILFISQGTIGKLLSQAAVELCKLIDDEYKIIYKLHPGEYARWKNEYPWLINSNIEVVDHNNQDMHFYFAKSITQVGVYSTALFEGLAYNLKTFIFPFFGSIYMENLVRNKLIEEVENTVQLFNMIQLIDNEFKINTKSIWEENSLKKIMYEIDYIISCSELYVK